MVTPVVTPQSKVTALSDGLLLERVRSLVRAGHRQLADMLDLLAEVDARKLYRGQGCSSMFAYCTERLHMSEGTAYKRIQAARLIRRYPEVLDRIAGGEIHLSAVAVLGPVLTPDNYLDLLGQCAHKSRREVAEIVARHAPRTLVRPHLRKVPNRDAQAAIAAESTELDGSSADNEGATATPASVRRPGASDPGHPSPTHRARDGLTPLDGETYRLHLTMSCALRDKLTLAQQLSQPGTTMAQVIERGLDGLIDKLMKRRFAATKRPRKTTSGAKRSRSKRTRHIPAEVRREVIKRDGLQCSFVSADGHRCSERNGLEFHHRKPYAKGGEHSVDNIALMCRPHNGYVAELDYGAEHMQRCIEQGREDTSTSDTPTRADRRGPSSSSAEEQPCSGAPAVSPPTCSPGERSAPTGEAGGTSGGTLGEQCDDAQGQGKPSPVDGPAKRRDGAVNRSQALHETATK